MSLVTSAGCHLVLIKLKYVHVTPNGRGEALYTRITNLKICLYSLKKLKGMRPFGAGCPSKKRKYHTKQQIIKQKHYLLALGAVV